MKKRIAITSYADILRRYWPVVKQDEIWPASYTPIQELGLYYLQSRYYNPEWGRFINADALVSTGQGLLGNNMFAYCRNNPVRRVDVSGKLDCECDDEENELLGNKITDWAGSGKDSPNRSNSTDNSNSTLPRQGLVTKVPQAPPVNAGAQGKHVVGHNNYDPAKSSWPEGMDGVQQTQEAWLNGVRDPRMVNQEVRIGISSDGMIIRVHMGKGAIHGYPYHGVHSFENH